MHNYIPVRTFPFTSSIFNTGAAVVSQAIVFFLVRMRGERRRGKGRKGPLSPAHAHEEKYGWLARLGLPNFLGGFIK